MKNLFSIFLLLFVASVYAQDTYMNEQTFNNSDDVIGTSRFVGMGGALGALGADLSVISWNPAGIGIYRKSDNLLVGVLQWGCSAQEAIRLDRYVKEPIKKEEYLELNRFCMADSEGKNAES